MRKALRLIRDILIAFGLYFGGSIWFTLVWPRADGLIGMFMVLGAVVDVMKINVRPFSDFSLLATYRTYFPVNLSSSEYRRVGWACFRFGIILTFIPWICYPLALMIAKEGEKIQGYVSMATFLFLAGMFFLIRTWWLYVRSGFNKYFGKR